MGLVFAKDIAEVTAMKTAYIVVPLAVALLWLGYSKFNSSYEAAHRAPLAEDTQRSASERPPISTAARLSPSKAPRRQEQLLRQVEVRLRANARIIDTKFGVKVLDRDDIPRDTWEVLIELSRILLRRSRTDDQNEFIRYAIQELGPDVGLAMYRAVLGDAKRKVTDCFKQDTTVLQEERLGRLLCANEHGTESCATAVDDLNNYMALQYPTISKMLGTHYIDDYGRMCQPFETLSAYTLMVKAKIPNKNARARFFDSEAGMFVGSSLETILINAESEAGPPPVAQKPSKPLHQKQRLRALRAVEGDLL